MIIGVHGRIGSGKDAFFERAERMHNQLGLPRPQRVSFADKLKDSACALLGITRDQMEEMKRDDTRGIKFVDSHLIYGEVEPDITMREFLQRYGTEAHRDIFGDDFWVDAALPKDLEHDGSLYICTDTRFENEAARIRDLGGCIVRMVGVSEQVSDHASEKPLAKVDFTIDNTVRNDDFAALDAAVREVLMSVGLG